MITPLNNREFSICPMKSYQTPANARKAIEKERCGHIRHFIMQCTQEGPHFNRYFPVFVGMAAIDECVHFKFNVIN